MKAPTPAGAMKIDPAQTHPVQELKHTSPLIGCRIDPTGQFVFAGAQDNALVRWHLASSKKTVLAGHKSWLRGIAFAAKEKLVFSGDYSGKMLAWPAETEAPQPTRSVQAHAGFLRALAVSPDGKLLASCGNDHLVKLWTVPDLKPVRTLAGHNCHVYNVAFHPAAPLLISSDLKGIVNVWDLEKGTVARELEAKALYWYDPTFMAGHGGARSMAFSPDGALLACAGITNVSNAFAGIGNPAVVLFDWTAGKVRHLLKPREAFQGTAWGVAFHPAGYLVGVAGGNGGILSFWKPEQATDVFTLKLPANARDLSLHPDGRRLAVPYNDGAVRLYDMGPKA
jgi:WD40 repeat protein